MLYAYAYSSSFICHSSIHVRSMKRHKQNWIALTTRGKDFFSQYITGHEILCGGHSLITEHTQKDDVDPIFVETHAQTIESGELLICTAVQTDATVLSIPLLFTENLLSETYSSGENLMESFSQTLLSLNRNGDNQ